MNPVTYQPIGAYKQFIQNQNPIFGNNNAAIKNTAAQESHDDKKKKIIKTAVIITGAAGICFALAAAYPKAKKLFEEYGEGTKWLIKKENMPEEIVDNASLDKYISKNPSQANKKYEYQEILKYYNNYQNSWVRRFRERIRGIKDFFQYNFYNY